MALAADGSATQRWLAVLDRLKDGVGARSVSARSACSMA
jgi:hypothetical protein